MASESANVGPLDKILSGSTVLVAQRMVLERDFNMTLAKSKRSWKIHTQNVKASEVSRVWTGLGIPRRFLKSSS